MHAARDLDLRQSVFTGPLRLVGAYIDGDLVCSGAQLAEQGAESNALTAYRMTVGGQVLLNKVTAARAGSHPHCLPISKGS